MQFNGRSAYLIIGSNVLPEPNNRLNKIVVNNVSGSSATPCIINIDILYQDYEIKVAKNSNGEIKVYCEADLIA